MTTNSLVYKFNKKLLWYLATVCGFTLGLLAGGAFLTYYDPLTPGQTRFMEIFFWAFPAGGAGLGMGFGQWILIRYSYKYAYLWIPIMTIGVTFIIGGALLVFTIMNYYHLGNLSWLFSNLPGWFVPLAVITPIIIFIGPFCQWLFIRQVVRHQTFKELIKICISWVLAIVSPFIMFYFMETFFNSRNDIFDVLAFFVGTILSVLIFAQATITAIRTT